MRSAAWHVRRSGWLGTKNHGWLCGPCGEAYLEAHPKARHGTGLRLVNAITSKQAHCERKGLDAWGNPKNQQLVDTRPLWEILYDETQKANKYNDMAERD